MPGHPGKNPRFVLGHSRQLILEIGHRDTRLGLWLEDDLAESLAVEQGSQRNMSVVQGVSL